MDSESSEARGEGFTLLSGKGLIRVLNRQVQAVEASWPKRDNKIARRLKPPIADIIEISS